jgi:hypothetical protein
MNTERSFLLRFRQGDRGGMRGDHEIDGSIDRVPDFRVGAADRRSVRSPILGRWYRARIVGQSPDRQVWFVNCLEEHFTATRLTLGDSDVVSVHLPDGSPARQGFDYDWFLTRREAGDLVVIVPQGVEAWFLLESSKVIRPGQSLHRVLQFVGVHVKDSEGAPVTVDFSQRWPKQREQPPCPPEVPSGVYEAVLAVVEPRIREGWATASVDIAQERDEHELVVARATSATLRDRAGRLRAHCLGDQTAAATIRAALDAIVQGDLQDADLASLNAWNMATQPQLETAERFVVAAEEAELAPFLALRKGMGKELARAVSKHVQQALAAGRDDLGKAIKWLKPKHDESRGFPRGDAIALAVDFLKARLAASPVTPAGPTAVPVSGSNQG